MAIYDLSGVSGKTVIDHPEAQRMLADLDAGRITGLIFYGLWRSRFGIALLQMPLFFHNQNTSSQPYPLWFDHRHSFIAVLEPDEFDGFRGHRIKGKWR